MKTKNLYAIVFPAVRFWDNLAADLYERQRRAPVTPLKSLTEIGIGVTGLNVILSQWVSQYGSAFIFLISCCALITAYVMRLYNREVQAKWLVIGTFNATLCLACYFAGLKTGTYLYYFPVIFAMVFLIDSKINRELLIIEAITMTFLGITFLFSPYEIQSPDASSHSFHYFFRTNLSLSLIFTGIVGYSILKTLGIKEEEMKSEKAFSDTIFNTSLDAIFIIDLDEEVVVDCNERVLDLFGYGRKSAVLDHTVESLLGRPALEIVRSFKPGLTQRVLPWVGNMEFEQLNGVPVYAHTNIVAFNHQGKRFVKMSVIDITQIKIAEVETLKAKEKAERAAMVKSRFLSNMSHELRTPLNAIIGTTNLLLDEGITDDTRPMLDVLRHSSEHMLELVNDVLDYSKLEADKMELEKSPFQLSKALNKLQGIFHPAYSSRNIKFILDSDVPESITLLGDELRLTQVLNNLLSNALKFTEKGQVVLGARIMNTTRDAVSIQFSVTDTGIGIQKEKLHRIFDKFYQTDALTTRKYGGSGLGLAISKYLVSLMGGTLQVDSVIRKGSSFSFMIQLPVEVNKAMVHPNERKDREKELEGVRVLVAEDNPINMMVVKKFLQKWGVQLTEACNGMEALEALREQPYDVLLVDLEMPVIDGAGVVAVSRKEYPQVPAIAFTAAVYENMMEDLHQKGFADFLPKPFRPDDLKEKILKHLVRR